MSNNNNNNNNTKPGLAKDDEDVRVQSTNDEATVARACVFDFVLHLFLSNSHMMFLSFFLSFFLSVRAHPSATYRTTRTPFCFVTGQKFGETNRCTI